MTAHEHYKSCIFTDHVVLFPLHMLDLKIGKDRRVIISLPLHCRARSLCHTTATTMHGGQGVCFRVLVLCTSMCNRCDDPLPII